MKRATTKEPADVAEGTLFCGEDWFDPTEAGVRIRRARRTFVRIRPFEEANKLRARIVMDWPQDAKLAYIFTAFCLKELA